jgi:hypothetical protein
MEHRGAIAITTKDASADARAGYFFATKGIARS